MEIQSSTCGDVAEFESELQQLCGDRWGEVEIVPLRGAEWNILYKFEAAPRKFVCKVPANIGQQSAELQHWVAGHMYGHIHQDSEKLEDRVPPIGSDPENSKKNLSLWIATVVSLFAAGSLSFKIGGAARIIPLAVLLILVTILVAAFSNSRSPSKRGISSEVIADSIAASHGIHLTRAVADEMLDFFPMTPEDGWIPLCITNLHGRLTKPLVPDEWGYGACLRCLARQHQFCEASRWRAWRKPCDCTAAGHPPRESPIREISNISIQKMLTRTKELSASLAVLLPFFIAWKVLHEAGYSVDVATDLLRSINASTFLQIAAMFSLTIISQVAPLVSLFLAVNLARYIPGKSATVSFVVAAVAAALLPGVMLIVILHNTSHLLIILQGFALVLLGATIISFMRSPGIDVASPFVVLYAGLILGVPGFMEKDPIFSLEEYLIFPTITIAMALVPLKNLQRWMVGLLTVGALVAAIATPINWMTPEMGVLPGSNRPSSFFEVRTEGSDTILLLGNDLARIPTNKISKREFCHLNSRTVSSVLRRENPNYPTCP